MSQYRVAPEAREDLKRISRHITQTMQSPQGAKRLRAKVLQTFRRLARNPHAGQACPEFGENLRLSLAGNYIVFYVPQSDGIDIVQVVHGAQDLPSVVRPVPGPS